MLWPMWSTIFEITELYDLELLYREGAFFILGTGAKDFPQGMQLFVIILLGFENIRRNFCRLRNNFA